MEDRRSNQLTVPRCGRITFGRRAFSVVNPMVWNSLPTEFRDLSVDFGVFRRALKTILFARYQCTAFSAIEMRKHDILPIQISDIYLSISGNSQCWN